MKLDDLIKNKYFLLLSFSLISSLILVVFFIPIVSYEDPFVRIIRQFDMVIDPDNFAPASVLFQSQPNTFSTCNFGDRISYFDGTGKKIFLDGNQRDIVPISSNALITTQTNRNIENFLIETHGTCTINSGLTGFTKVKAVADSGVLKHEVFYAKPDGTMIKIYSKSTTLTDKNIDLSSDKLLFSAKITAKELEDKMTHPSDSYKSNIRIKTSLDLYLHYVGVPGVETAKWMIGGISESTLKITVTNDKYQCLIGCLFTNKEIKTEFTPSDGNVKYKSIINFKVTLPEWQSDQGSPSFRVVNSETGVEITPKSPITLAKSGTNGIGSKSLLSPLTVGKYDIVITHPNRDTAIIPFNVYKEIVVPPEEPPEEKCPEGYVFIDNDCFLENPPPNNNPPLIDSESADALKEWFSCVSQGFESSCHEKYYGYYGAGFIFFVIILILKFAFKSKG